MKLGIAGSGKIVQEFLPWLAQSPAVEVAALCSTQRSAEQAKALCQQYGVPLHTTDYRQMLDVGSLDDADIFTTNGILSFPVYGAGYEDESGYGIFFVDADATSVVLSLPCQTVDADDTDRMEYQEVIDVEIPFTE